MLTNWVLRLVVFPALVPCTAMGSNYYFSSVSGDDARSSQQAQHARTPWKTISKLNAFFSQLRPGDSILFRRGEVFNGTVNVTVSGSSSAPVVFAAYGSGPRPVLSALTALSAWQKVSKGIFKAASTAHLPAMQMLVLNGVQQPMGRYPNKGYLVYRQQADSNSVAIDQPAGMPGRPGAEMVIRKNRWVIDRNKIISRRGNAISYTGGGRDRPTDGFGFFIQDDPETLDLPGEWYFDAAKKELYVFFGNRNPATCKMEVSDQDFLVLISGQRFVEFKDLVLEGAGTSAFKISGSNHIAIRHCQIDLSATDAINATGSAYLNIENCRIDHSQNDAIKLDRDCPFAQIRLNVIKNTGLMPGMGESGSGSYQAVILFGDNSLVEYNEIDSTGYNAIYFGGNLTQVKNNRVSNFCSVKDDGAGIYVGDWTVTGQKKITGNIVFNGIGALAGVAPGRSDPQVEGIYIDDNSSGVDIQSNVIFNCPDAGIKIHNAHEVTIEENTAYNNRVQLLIAEDTFSSRSAVKNIACNRNIFFCRSAGQLCLNLISTAEDLDSFASMEGNRYIGPAGKHEAIRLVSKIWSASSLAKDLSLAQWQEMYKQDGQSKQVSFGELPVAAIDVCHNFSATARVISMKGTYITPAGTTRSDRYVLQPYQSVLYIRDP